MLDGTGNRGAKKRLRKIHHKNSAPRDLPRENFGFLNLERLITHLKGENFTQSNQDRIRITQPQSHFERNQNLCGKSATIENSPPINCELVLL